MSTTSPRSSTLFHFGHRFHLPRSNVNYVGAIVFTIGCFVLVANAILSFLPYAGSGFHLPPKIVYVEGVLSIMSNLFFLAGSFFAFVQILNAKRAELYDESKSKMAVSEEDMGLKAEKPPQTHSETPSVTSQSSGTPRYPIGETSSISSQDSESPPPSYRASSSASSANVETPPPSYRERSSVVSANFETPPHSYCERPSIPSGDSIDCNVNAVSTLATTTSSQMPTMSSEDSPVIEDKAVGEKSFWLYDEKPKPFSGTHSTTPADSQALTTSSLDPNVFDMEATSEHGNWLAETLAPVMGIYATTPASSTTNLTADFKSSDGKDLESQSEAPHTRVPDELWRYIPSRHEIWVRSIHEIGFLATTIFFCSSLLYFSTSIASLVTIGFTGEISRWIRYPQLIAAVGFAVAAIILMVQAQERWWRPALHRLRWYVNFLNLVGSAGFIFCACFGLIQDVSWARYQFGMSYLWGSWAFLFGSMMQWYKSQSKPAIGRTKKWANDDYDGDEDLMF